MEPSPADDARARFLAMLDAAQQHFYPLEHIDAKVLADFVEYMHARDYKAVHNLAAQASIAIIGQIVAAEVQKIRQFTASESRLFSSASMSLTIKVRDCALSLLPDEFFDRNSDFVCYGCETSEAKAVFRSCGASKLMLYRPRGIGDVEFTFNVNTKPRPSTFENVASDESQISPHHVVQFRLLGALRGHAFDVPASDAAAD